MQTLLNFASHYVLDFRFDAFFNIVLVFMYQMIEEHSQVLELNLMKEKAHCLKLSNEVHTLKERCACLEHENAKLRMRHNSGNLRTDAESECDNCNVSFVMHVVDSQNDVKDEYLVRDDNNNTLRVGN